MQSQFILASVKLEIADRERHADHARHAIECRETPMRRSARRLAALRHRALAIAPPSNEAALAGDQNPSV